MARCGGGSGVGTGVAILARGAEPQLVRRRLPGEPEDGEPRYLEAAVDGVLIGCLYLPNGNPQPGPKFDYKLRWFGRLIAHAGTLLATGLPVVLAGDYNVVPTDFDIYDTRSWRSNALLRPEARAAFERLLAQGWVDALRALHPTVPLFTFWDYMRDRWKRDAGLRLDHLLLSPAGLAARSALGQPPSPALRWTPKPASSSSGTRPARSTSPRAWRRAARCRASFRPSPSTGGAISTAASARRPASTWRKAL